MWSWYAHSPGLSKVKLHSSPGRTGLLGSNPGYNVCIGWSSDAGQWALSPSFSNDTVSPGPTSTDCGSKPASVTCTTTVPSPSWADAAHAGASKRTTDTQASRQNRPLARGANLLEQ